jgi:hypothetical protein
MRLSARRKVQGEAARSADIKFPLFSVESFRIIPIQLTENATLKGIPLGTGVALPWQQKMRPLGKDGGRVPNFPSTHPSGSYRP